MGQVTAKVFENGRSQAVRIPKEYRFDCDEVLVARKGRSLILTPRPRRLSEYFNNPNFRRLSADFPTNLPDPPAEDLDPL